MTEDQFVSVIIPNYNYARYVGDAIESVMVQTYSYFELIVVDNGSTDNSKQVLEEFGNKYSPRLRVIFQDNRGQAGSRNRGIEESKGDLIAFLDADDVWMPNKLEEQVKLLVDPEVGLVYSSYWISDQNLKKIKIQKAEYRGDVLKYFATKAYTAVVVGGESNAIIRKECFDKVGYFDTDLEESTGWDMYRRIASCFHLDYVDLPLMKYRIHGNNLHKTNSVIYKQLELQANKMFEDPMSSRIFHLRSKCYSQVHFGIAVAHYKSKNIIGLFRHIVLAITFDPLIIVKLLGFNKADSST